MCSEHESVFQGQVVLTCVASLYPEMTAVYHWVVPSARYTWTLKPFSTLGVVSRICWPFWLSTHLRTVSRTLEVSLAPAGLSSQSYNRQTVQRTTSAHPPKRHSPRLTVLGSSYVHPSHSLRLEKIDFIVREKGRNMSTIFNMNPSYIR